jgi:hypothetical protein
LPEVDVVWVGVASVKGVVSRAVRGRGRSAYVAQVSPY